MELKLKMSDRDSLFQLFNDMLRSYEDGACFVATDLDKVICKYKTSKFDIPEIEVGSYNKQSGIADHVFKIRNTAEFNLDASVYGIRTHVLAGPLWSDDLSEVTGTWSITQPRLHKVAHGFDSFAPILVEMFSEGGFLYIANREKVIKRQGSHKFDIAIQVGESISLLKVAKEVLNSGKPVTEELPAGVYGVPVLTACYPLFNEGDREVIGIFGLLLPRALPVQMKSMASNLGDGLGEVSATVQEIAASSTQVIQNQNSLHDDIIMVQQHANEINEVMNFIKNIADETKMLGLNAAIEAARAGEAGRGFGVVAGEIRKLSEDSKKTVAEIREITAKIEESIRNTIKASESTLRVTEEQAAATEEISASVEQMASMAEELDAIAEKL